MKHVTCSCINCLFDNSIPPQCLDGSLPARSWQSCRRLGMKVVLLFRGPDKIPPVGSSNKKVQRLCLLSESWPSVDRWRNESNRTKPGELFRDLAVDCCVKLRTCCLLSTLFYLIIYLIRLWHWSILHKLNKYAISHPTRPMSTA